MLGEEILHITRKKKGSSELHAFYFIRNIAQSLVLKVPYILISFIKF